MVRLSFVALRAISLLVGGCTDIGAVDRPRCRCHRPVSHDHLLIVGLLLQEFLKPRLEDGLGRCLVHPLLRQSLRPDLAGVGAGDLKHPRGIQGRVHEGHCSPARDPVREDPRLLGLIGGDTKKLPNLLPVLGHNEGAESLHLIVGEIIPPEVDS